GSISVNHPVLWQQRLPQPSAQSHKYKRGHLAVFSGGASHTGAARLAAAAGLAAGAGLVTVASPADAMPSNASHLTAVMLREADSASAVRAWLTDAKLDRKSVAQVC